MSTALRSVGLLDVLSSTSAGPSVARLVSKRLKQQVPAKKMSSFINDAVRTKLRPDKAMLDAAYKAARKEACRNTLAEDWAATEAEGWPK